MGNRPATRTTLSRRSHDKIVVNPAPVLSSTTKTWLNLKGNPFEENPAAWYNLQTNRFLKNPPRDPQLNSSLRGIRVLGTRDHLIEFWKRNIDQLGQVYPKGTKFEQVVFQPFTDIAFLTEDAARRSQLCYLGTAGTVISSTHAQDVEQLTNDEINQMCPFSFAGLFVKARVDSVVDGDTLNVIFLVPLMELGSARAIGPKGAARTTILTSSPQPTSFFVYDTIRMYGYDAQEKDTPEGQTAKRLFEQKLASLNNIVWCQFVEANIAQEKYGRILAVLYEDKERTRPLNDYLFRQQQQLGIKLVNPYLGGTKTSF